MQKNPLIVVTLLIALAGPARAQVGTAPYDTQLQRLAEILGSLHYLRPLCGANDGQRWRTEMQSIMESDAPSGVRRERMIASFNRGYRGFQQTYRACTPAAELAIRRYFSEGTRIIRDVTARYSN